MRLSTSPTTCHCVRAIASADSLVDFRLPCVPDDANCDLGMSLDSAKTFVPRSGPAGETKSFPWYTPCDDSQANTRSGLTDSYGLPASGSGETTSDDGVEIDGEEDVERDISWTVGCSDSNSRVWGGARPAGPRPGGPARGGGRAGGLT